MKLSQPEAHGLTHDGVVVKSNDIVTYREGGDVSDDSCRYGTATAPNRIAEEESAINLCQYMLVSEVPFE